MYLDSFEDGNAGDPENARVLQREEEIWEKRREIFIKIKEHEASCNNT